MNWTSTRVAPLAWLLLAVVISGLCWALLPRLWAAPQTPCTLSDGAQVVREPVARLLELLGTMRVSPPQQQTDGLTSHRGVLPPQDFLSGQYAFVFSAVSGQKVTVLIQTEALVGHLQPIKQEATRIDARVDLAAQGGEVFALTGAEVHSLLQQTYIQLREANAQEIAPLNTLKDMLLAAVFNGRPGALKLHQQLMRCT
jgi:hypothetical protein